LFPECRRSRVAAECAEFGENKEEILVVVCSRENLPQYDSGVKEYRLLKSGKARSPVHTRTTTNQRIPMATRSMSM